MSRLPTLFILQIFFIAAVKAQRGFLSIDCGANDNHTDNSTGITWVSDIPFISSGIGTARNVSATALIQNQTELSTLRTFSATQTANKYCYVIQVPRQRTYLVRTAYIYGNYDGLDKPPRFLEILDGTITALIQTVTAQTVYSENIIKTTSKIVTVCVARFVDGRGDPFISSIELRSLPQTFYNPTDFSQYCLRTVARDNFGYTGDNVFRYPSDRFDRMWNPFESTKYAEAVGSGVTVSGLWNEPPNAVMLSGLAGGSVAEMNLTWPAQSLPSGVYYIALYFANLDGNSSSSKMFDVLLDGTTFVKGLNLTEDSAWGVFSPNWTLVDSMELVLRRGEGSGGGPIVNAGEVFSVIALGGRTVTRDINALTRIKKSFERTPLDWEGDPCLPFEHGWTGISCDQGNKNKIFRVTSINLTDFEVGGTLSPSISGLTALTHLWLGSNRLTGPIPNLSSLKLLQTLHLENNNFDGAFPEYLKQLSNLREIYVFSNDISGIVPQELENNTMLDLRTWPGNPSLIRVPIRKQTSQADFGRSNCWWVLIITISISLIAIT